MNKDTEMWVSTVYLGNAHHLVVTWTSLLVMDSTRIRILDLSHICLFTCFPVSSYCSYFWAVSDSPVLCLWNGWGKVFWNKLKKKRVRDPPSCLILCIELKLYPSQWIQVGKYNEVDWIISKVPLISNPNVGQSLIKSLLSKRYHILFNGIKSEKTLWLLSKIYI